jgi:hypothetical protein
MPEDIRPLAAVHYYYLLKSDDEDLRRLWMALTGNANMDSGSPLSSALPQLGLSETATTDRRCHVVQTINTPEGSFCLCQLPDISVLEVTYGKREESIDGDWLRAAAAIDADRTRVLTGINSVFGETTLLIAPAVTSVEAIVDAIPPAVANNDRAYLQTRLDPGAAGTGPAMLVNFPNLTAEGRDYYALASDNPSQFSTNMLPEMDSLIKKLNRYAAYFEIQRQAIVSERADVDHQVGALLHRQVVSEAGAEPETATMEDQITSLSRLFGMLATDSLLVRKHKAAQSGTHVAGGTRRHRRDRCTLYKPLQPGAGGSPGRKPQSRFLPPERTGGHRGRAYPG